MSDINDFILLRILMLVEECFFDHYSFFFCYKLFILFLRIDHGQ
jgi:hypothetical protein